MDGFAHGAGSTDAPGDARRALAAHALEVLAHAWSRRPVREVPAPRTARTPAPTPQAVAALEQGVAALASALGVAGTGPVVVDAAVGEDDLGARARAALVRAAEIADGLAEAARFLGHAAGSIGQEPAAEVADDVMTAAMTLRILVGVGLRTVPPVDGAARAR